MMMGPMMIVQIIVLYLLGPPDGSGPKANMLLVAAARLLGVGMGVFCFFVGFYLAYGACEYVEVSEGGVVIGRRNKRRLPWSEIEEATLVLNEPGYYFAPQLTLASGETIVLTVVRGSGEGARSPGGRVVRAIRSGLKSHYDVHRSG